MARRPHPDATIVIRNATIGVLLASLVGCSSPAPAVPTAADKAAPAATTAPAATAAPATTPAAADANEHLVVALQGGLALKRSTWSQFLPATFGTAVRAGDLLRVDGSGSAKIACADLTLVTVQAGTSGVPCQVARVSFQRETGTVRATRSDSTSGFPVVIAPRKTNLLAERPLIRWTAVTGASAYKVSVRGPGVNWSADVTGKTELAYPPEAPALTPGEGYKVTVAATTPSGSRSSDEESLPDLGFVPLKPEQREAVRAEAARIDTLDLGDPQKRFLQARLYASREHRLYGESLELLEALSGTLKEPAVNRELAEAYRAVSLNRLAEQRFIQSIELAEQARDLEGQALAQDALGRLYEALGNPAGATQRTQKSIEFYQQIGDAKKVEELQARLAKLPKA